VKGLVTNVRSTAGRPFKLVFDFLSAKGDVVATRSTDVPALPPQGTQQFELKAPALGAQAWRYHRE